MQITLRQLATSSILACAVLVAQAHVATAAPIYADSAVFVDTLAFGSGILTGAPDGGGRFLSDTFDPPTLFGSITAGFSGGLIDGAGDDIVIHDCCEGPDIAAGSGLPDVDEFADVFVSTDGIAFTLLGAYGGPGRINAFDLSGVFAGVVHFVRIVNTGKTNSPDIDAFEGRFAAIVPEPATWALLGLGLVAIVLRVRLRTRP